MQSAGCEDTLSWEVHASSGRYSLESTHQLAVPFPWRFAAVHGVTVRVRSAASVPSSMLKFHYKTVKMSAINVCMFSYYGKLRIIHVDVSS